MMELIRLIAFMCLQLGLAHNMLAPLLLARSPLPSLLHAHCRLYTLPTCPLIPTHIPLVTQVSAWPVQK